MAQFKPWLTASAPARGEAQEFAAAMMTMTETTSSTHYPATTHHHSTPPPRTTTHCHHTPPARPFATQRLLRRQIHGSAARPASTPNSVGAEWEDHALLGLPGFTPGTLASPLPGSWRDSKTGAMQSPAHPRYASAPRYPGGIQPTHLADIEAAEQRSQQVRVGMNRGEESGLFVEQRSGTRVSL